MRSRSKVHQEVSLEEQTWSVQVARVDPGATTLDPCFSDAIYEHLLRELRNSKQFTTVFRSGERNANECLPGACLKDIR